MSGKFILCNVLAHLWFASEKTEGKGLLFYQTGSDRSIIKLKSPVTIISLMSSIEAKYTVSVWRSVEESK